MELLESHRGQHIVAGILLSVVIHVAILQANKFPEKNIAAEIFSPPSIVSFQFVKKKKVVPKPVVIEKPQEPIVKEVIIEEVIEEIQEEDVPEEPVIKKTPEQENIIPVITDVKLKGKRITPKYPKRSLRLGQQGVVLINVLIAKNGVQKKMVIVKSSNYPLLDKSALDAVRKWEFSPTIRDGIPILSWIQVPVEFTIR